LAEIEGDRGLLVVLATEGGTVELKVRQHALQEGGAVALAATLSDDVKAVDGTREGDIEQIQIVDGILQVLVQILGLVDGAAHLLLAIVDGGDGQRVERLYGRLAP